MVTVPFNVNNSEIRKNFLKQEFMEAVCALTPETRPRWGAMTPQHMVEHLLWTFEFSTGDVNIHREVPPVVAERTRRFLHDDRPTPHEFKNPLLGDVPPPLRFANLEESKAALRNSIDRFFDLYTKDPQALHDHPIFGPLGADDWERALFKHCYHHLLQFGQLGP